jgi:molecular chaperone GrpE
MAFLPICLVLLWQGFCFIVSHLKKQVLMKKHKDTEEHMEQQPLPNEWEAQNQPAEVVGEPETAAEEWSVEEKLADANDKYLRLVAEFDNFRKRIARERLELLLTAGGEVIGGLLPVLDDMERALCVMQCDAEREGVKLIYDKLYGILQGKGLQRMEVLGAELDTDRHEAVAKTPAPTPEQKGKVIDEVQAGYMLNGKIIRYAKVVMGE